MCNQRHSSRLYNQYVTNIGGPQPQTRTGLWSDRKQATQQEVSSEQAKLHPHCSHHCPSSASWQIRANLKILIGAWTLLWTAHFGGASRLQLLWIIPKPSLNPPPPQSVEKLSSTKWVPSAQEVGDHTLKLSKNHQAKSCRYCGPFLYSSFFFTCA